MALKINELRQTLKNAENEIGALLQVQVDGGQLNATQQARKAKLTADVPKLERAVLDEETRLALEDAHLAGNPSGRLEGTSEASAASRGGIGKRWASLFGPPRSAAADGFERGRAEFFGALSAGLHHPAMLAAHTVGIGEDGGFLAPEEFVAQAFDGAIEDEPILRAVTIEPMKGESKRVSGFASENHTSAGPFGFSGGWIPEGGTISAEKGVIRSMLLQAKKLALLVQASSEVAADGEGFETQLDRAMRSALGWSLAEAVFNGNGAGKPMGMLSASCTVAVPKEVGQAADTVSYANIVKMLARLLPSSATRAAWYVSHTTRPQLMQLSVPIGTAGQFVPLTFEGGVYRLLGLPLYFTEHLPAVGDQGDVLLADASMYTLGLRNQVTIDKSAHVGFTSDLMTYRGIVRADGQPKLDKPFTPKNGDTQSPFIVLADRA